MNVRKPAQDALENRKKIAGQIIADVTRTREGLKLHHKIIYTSCIFLGVVLVWYGLWDIISRIPFLKEPIVALGTGVALLFFTGTFFKELS